jgi:hypothetical protein
MVMKKASDGDSPLRQGPGMSFWTLPILRQRRWWLVVCFKENLSGLGFSRHREYIGGRVASGGGPGGLTPWWHGQGLAHAALGCGRVLAPLRLVFGL